MGLLDQVLGQVIGNMAGGGRASPADPPRTGRPTGAPSPGGGLGDLLGGAAGKYSPLVMALLALLASKHLNTGAGGYGSVLRDILDRVTGSGARADDEGRFEGQAGAGYEDDEMEEPPPFEEAPYGEPRGRLGRGAREDRGGFLDSVGSLLDGPGGSAPLRAAGDDLPGGELGGVVGTGLDGLLDRFEQHGRGDLMRSWIGEGPNAPVSPHELDEALGSGAVDELSRRTGLGRDDLLAQLSRALPQVVDGLTPRGRVPGPDEQRGWI